MRRLLADLARASCASLLCACASGADVGGVWRGQAPRQGAANDILFGPSDEPLGIELVLAEFGPDVTGLLRHYSAGDFTRVRRAEAPDRQCACGYLHQGRVDIGTERVSFTLRGCLPGGATQANLRVRGQFLREADRLVGTLRVDEPGHPLHERAIELSLERVAAAGEVGAAELACSQPGDAAQGNIHSGR